MDVKLTLSRYRLEAYLACQRRFQLRYLRKLPWPSAPLDERAESVRLRGEAFHQLLERHFLNLPITAETIDDVTVRRWWSLFRNSGPELPPGERHPERSLTIPIGQFFLNGRFDLIILYDQAAHIFDWKTGRPRTEAELRRDWQTRLYLGMVAESGQALGSHRQPDQIAMTYWYVNDPAAPQTIHYSQSWHRQNWSEVQEIIAQLEELTKTSSSHDAWPLTDDWSRCRQCAYQTYCGRQEAGLPVVAESEEQENEGALSLEPELP